MAKRNKKIKNQLLQSIKNNKLIDNNLQVQNSEQNNTDISESTDSFFPINQRDLIKVFINTILILVILVGFYYLQNRTNYSTDYTEKIRSFLHF
ncbi:hypothetical protein COZ61_00075 [Candidatus Berkelbacteria bacterium CG_4_8_14_3_um_filter_33_6]|uniref:Uncharacterized protein n=1 Tax=Candidatus Berkelbacteria bacterium CG_4_10_14_0_2_um_filter_35_9_33_12 TaxID=1974499 RepID=A0A2M7W554_9BACT|nr:MAG: hypothetical protein COX10_02615 [Candidatus Berkelbacteria bacterium CG23_combo_of_CG06-09_8_20_14_all_33_15]PIS08655.1 MAG: hypothetical protein COT76_00045 [Candidatus Berkelbacteria bacterium CG10_big_fil_rev_8_21_14_0_10_33_10]PIX31374.1 MAG: hypothetical protein COZ61_00075 [Candidatus Berkelbacteria bacterium CG_4_8_14_3_um_filter_33_6]PIZ28277.1 MAG: hypothetical protein COY43_01315 [Candidatus Berkelbacteria bacterium CG_4_10_14_0_8_um_filter_35_9_33_8]PJA20570.1 MAG: hypotheti